MTDSAIPTASTPLRPSQQFPSLLIAALLAIQVVYERLQGRIWWCKCGRWNPVSLDVWSEHNSQHVFDPYSLSHFSHGLIFFGVLWLARRWISMNWRLVCAVAIEVAWEMCENSPFIINRYREATVSLGYTGDSLANSLGDVVSLAIGFWIASKLNLVKAIALYLLLELLMLWWIRDNLALNVLMLLWPLEAIRKWQSGG